MNQTNQDNINLVQCGDHSWAPWSIVCTHLMEGTSRDWRPVESDNPEVDYDWFCPPCRTKLEEAQAANERPDIADMQCICMHCVRFLRNKFDPNFKKEDSNAVG
jgi:hypothetical protein